MGCNAQDMLNTAYQLGYGKLSERDLVAVSVAATCTLTSSGTLCVVGGVAAPTGTPPCNFAIYIQQPGPNFGLWLGDLSNGWSSVIAQGP
jgi:hypothetical protein